MESRTLLDALRGRADDHGPDGHRAGPGATADLVDPAHQLGAGLEAALLDVELGGAGRRALRARGRLLPVTAAARAMASDGTKVSSSWW